MSERTQAQKITICVQYSKVALSQSVTHSARVGIELPGQLKTVKKRSGRPLGVGGGGCGGGEALQALLQQSFTLI